MEYGSNHSSITVSTVLVKVAYYRTNLLDSNGQIDELNHKMKLL